MKRERELEHRIASLQTLGQAVAAMKSLSAHHFRAARDALEPSRAYREHLDRLLQSTGASLPAGLGSRGLVVIGGELGLCGSYNARVAVAAADYRNTHGAGPTFCVGRRAASYLRRQGVPLDRVYAAPTGVRGIPDTLLALAGDIIGAYIEQNLSSFALLANEFQGVGAFDPRSTQLLPIVTHPVPGAPRPRYVSRDHIAAVAVRELLYITLVELLLDALASEQGARLVATQAAEQWLDERLTVLQRRLSAARRETSTQEVIEIASGARVRRRTHEVRLRGRGKS